VFTDKTANETGDRRIWVNAIDPEVGSSIPSLYQPLVFRGPYALDMVRCHDLVGKLDADRRWQEVTTAHLRDRQES